MSEKRIQTSNGRRGNRGGIEYRVVYALGFGVFLCASLGERMIRLLTLRRGDGRSVLRQARDAADATIPYAFMG